MAISTAHSPGDPARAELRLPPNVSAPAVARRAVNDLLGAVPAAVRAQLSLVASELVTNVLRHSTAADPDPRLTLALGPDRITLTVTDAGDGFDPTRRRTSDDPGGWGLMVLDAIADRWWVEQDGRTRVICEIDRKPPSRGAAAEAERRDALAQTSASAGSSITSSRASRPVSSSTR